MRPFALAILIPLFTACGPTAAPIVHRVIADACVGARPAAGCGTFGPPSAECTIDSQCTTGNNGRCLPPTHNGTCFCSYDTCNSDADCPAETLCACGAVMAGGRAANTCLPSNCRVDADCGAGQYCSPSLDAGCGRYSGITRWACTSSSDTCRRDADCGASADDTTGPFCGYSPEVGHFSCLDAQCAG